MVNVEEIMGNIRSEIERNGCVEDDLRFLDICTEEDFIYEIKTITGERFTWDELWKDLEEANKHWHIHAVREDGNGILKGVIKKLVRKIVGFIINPIVDEQNTYNMELIRALNDIRRFVDEQNSVNKINSSQIEELKLQCMNKARKQMDCIQRKHKELEQSMNQLQIMREGRLEAEKKIQSEMECLRKQIILLENQIRKNQ